MLNFALTQMLGNALFMATGCIEGKPARRAGYFRANFCAGNCGSNILEDASLQSFAILTWCEGIPQGNENSFNATGWAFGLGEE
jgi:hypothetical protein